MKNLVQQKINNFADANKGSAVAVNFADMLSAQFENLVSSGWDNKEDVEAIVLGENDVLERACNDGDVYFDDVDFDWNDARDLQWAVINYFEEV